MEASEPAGCRGCRTARHEAWATARHDVDAAIICDAIPEQACSATVDKPPCLRYPTGCRPLVTVGTPLGPEVLDRC